MTASRDWRLIVELRIEAQHKIDRDQLMFVNWTAARMNKHVMTVIENQSTKSSDLTGGQLPRGLAGLG
jgi:hypothetical protein